MPVPALAAPTQPPDHQWAKRHFYTCDSITYAWEPEWYTQPFYTASSSSYDAAASKGPVNPPGSVLGENTACAAETRSGSGSETAGAGVTESRREGTTVVRITTTSGGSTFEATITSVLGPTASSDMTTASATGGASSGQSSSSTPTAIASASTSIASTSPSTSVTLSSSSSTVASQAQVTDPSSINNCAGDLDFQAWGAMAGAGFTVLIGGLLWLLWALLRGRLPALYSPRTYFVPSDSRPSKAFSLLAFLFPFLPSTSAALGSSATSSLPVVLASLKLLIISSLVALAAGLPLLLVNNPCIGQTSPTNFLGGRLGSLSDLSLLRLLNSLDPAPESASRDSSIQLLLQLSPIRRALPQTIGPALSSARVRLTVILVLVGLLSLVGGLWIVTRTYAQISARRRKFEKETCGGMEMVVVSAKDAPGWKSVSEERLRKMLLDAMQPKEEGQGSEAVELSVVGVFAITDTTALRAKVEERETALLHLEAEEADYLLGHSGQHGSTAHLPRSQPDTPFTPAQPPIASTSRIAGRSSADISQSSRTPHRPSFAARREPSRFREINRNSLQASFVQFEIGQRIKVDESGKFVPDPSPESEEGHSGVLGAVSESEGESGDSGEADSRASEGSRDEARLHDGPARQLDLQPSPPYRSVQPSAVPSPSSHPSPGVETARTRLKVLDDQVEALQLVAMRSAATGADTVGWVIVGRGVRFIPGGTRIEGCTIEDIDWRNVGARAGGTRFWARIAILGVILGLILIPFIGLSNASSPGFAHYLPFLGPLARSDGFGSGAAQGFVPGLVMCFVVLQAIRGSIFLAHRVPTISRSRRDVLATQATFWLMLSLCIAWALLVSSLEFAVQGLAGDAQKLRDVADGSIYSTWWLFVFLLNVAIISPATILLQPRRLLRHFRKRRTANTPRLLFRLSRPAHLSPALLLAGPLLAVLYTLSLSLIFPVLCIPLLILLYLSFVILRHMTDRVFVDFSFSDGYLGLWLVRRLGWCLGIQPLLYGLILLSRREWAIGGVSCAIALLAVILSEALTARRLPEKRRKHLDSSTRSSLDAVTKSMRFIHPAQRSHSLHSRSASDSSMLQRLTTLLPGYSRLPTSCPLPLRPHTIDDMVYTELASVTRRDLVVGRDKDGDRFFHDPSETNRGLVYPPEMLQPTAVVWLPYTRGGGAESEAAELEGIRGLVAIVDPAPMRREGGIEKDKRKSKDLGN